jgi:hypothetical protein
MIAQAPLFAIAGELGTLSLQTIKQHIGTTKRSRPSLSGGLLAEEKQFAGINRCLSHFVMEENRHFRRSFVRRKNPFGPIDSNRIRERVFVAKVRQIERSDKYIEVSIGRQRKFSEQDRSTPSEFGSKFVPMSGNPSYSFLERRFGRTTDQNLRKDAFTVQLLAGDGTWFNHKKIGGHTRNISRKGYS